MRFHDRCSRSILATLAVAGGCAGAAAAQEEGSREVDAKFEQAAPTLQEKGLGPRGARHYGSLADDTAQRITVSVDFAPALFLGLCDNGCTDLDLVLLDAGGATLDSDQLADAYPIVTAREPGSYTIEVRMAACADGPCRYGVQAYSR